MVNYSVDLCRHLHSLIYLANISSPSLLTLNSKFVFFNVQFVHCSQLTLTQALLQKKKILTQAKLPRFIQITLCKCQFIKECERMKERREKKNTIGSAIQIEVKDVHGGD